MENIRKIQNILLLKYKYTQMIKYKIFYYQKLKERNWPLFFKSVAGMKDKHKLRFQMKGD